MNRVDGKVAIVTGAAGGIGRASAMLFAERGAKVVAVDLKEADGEETVRMIAEGGGEAIFAAADVTDVPQVQELVGKTLTAFGRVDFLHNNAAIIAHHRDIDDVGVDEWRRIIDVNLSSLFICSKAVIPMMRTQGGGAIVNTSSGAGVAAYGVALAYSAAKFGVLGLTQGLQQLVEGDDNIRVNAVLPGMTRTPMLELSDTGRAALQKPENAARPHGPRPRRLLSRGQRRDARRLGLHEPGRRRPRLRPRAPQPVRAPERRGGILMGKLDGKAAIVTGAGSGMGRATAALLASEGAKVVVADIDETGAAETVSLIAADGRRGRSGRWATRR